MKIIPPYRLAVTSTSLEENAQNHVVKINNGDRIEARNACRKLVVSGSNVDDDDGVLVVVMALVTNLLITITNTIFKNHIL